MIALLCFLFFLSGASALIFENVWFQLAGITFGNSVWAGSIVLAGFMGGLALGNALAARYGRRIENAVLAYARLEILIGVTGVILVLGFPYLSGWLAPLFRPLLEQPWLINPLRLLIAFVLMLVPTTAMGMTLPLLVKVLFARDPHFGRILGKLYGWNTLGAVVGALAGEILLIEWLGLRGTGFVAGGFNLAAAAVAIAIAGRLRAGVADEPAKPVSPGRLTPTGLRLLLGSFLAGGILLAFEVVWFRFLQLFVMGTSFSFAVMLATVLAGIGLGGLAASAWLRLRRSVRPDLVGVALGSGIVAVLVYRGFSPPAIPLAGSPDQGWEIALLALVLVFPVSFLSGVLFTMFGEAAQREIEQETRTAGLLTLANTVGAMLGAVLGGFLLLPLLGVERSFFLLALLYLGVALCALSTDSWRRPLVGVLGGAFVLMLFVFPFGAMQGHLDQASSKYRERFGSETIAAREGLTETIQYLRKDFEGRPLNYRLMTNGYSMSGTSLDSRRYMKAFVYWPVAIHPGPESALLIGYGAGSTAEALVDTKSLRSIDVVDISRDILEMSEVLYPEGGNPLDDPRVNARVEDGRYFLQTTGRRFDIITAEPPPPVVGGAVNLYTREYFGLIRDRLSEGGITTYWLPLAEMTPPTARAILSAFCDAFDDCSLWSGCKLHWMMVGSRNGTSGTVPAERIARQWVDPVVGPEMRALGLEMPQQLGATFIGDARRVAEIVDGVLPLTDNHPQRLEQATSSQADRKWYRGWTELADTQRSFYESPWVRQLWPPELIRDTLPYFKYQGIANMQVYPNDPNVLRMIDDILERPTLRTAALWLMGSSVDHEKIAVEAEAQGGGENIDHYLGARALANRQYELAASYFGRNPQQRPRLSEPLHIMALCKAGRTEEARELGQRFSAAFGPGLNYACW